MTSHIDRLLARARLVNEPCSPHDIDAAAERIAQRAAAHRAHPRNPPAHTTVGGPQDAAADDLRTLCETAVMSAGALATLRRFISRCLPEPPAARVLGCILQLTEQEDSARFWWQYAAGAGDSAATYCLYLHHKAHGEQPEADWWHTQAAKNARDRGEPDAGPQEVTTALRLLRALQADAPTTGLAARAAHVSAVLDYVPAALAYVDDDLELPLPDADFPDHITSLTATPAAPPPHPGSHKATAAAPERQHRSEPPTPAATARPAIRPRRPSTPAPATEEWTWHDSGGAFGHIQRTGSFTAAARRRQAMEAFWQHCEECADCDPAGIPCPNHEALWLFS
ncbi:hypothetical protein [Streptomyces sp. NPDC046197]|uniref:hypothetical protein n=1 Tax=Streptomyces sp. NPDC046197 TaxID=3154337 RepID=UPI0033C1A3A9